jgi:hypothetical protein
MAQLSLSPRLKTIGINTLLSLGGIVFALGVMEIALRILGVSYPSFYRPEEQRGHALIPNLSGLWTHEGRGEVKINSDGLRDGEHIVPKPPQTYRIAVLGDSFAEAIQVDAPQAFWAVMEQELSQCPALEGQRVEAINFGVGDYGTAQQLMTLRTQVGKYEPDLILLQIFTGNDLVNNSRALSPGDRLAPFWLKDAQGNWAMDFSFQTTPTYQRRRSALRQLVFTLINHSRVLQVLNEAKRAIVQGRPLATAQPQDSLDALIPSLDFDANLYRPPTTPAWQEAWQITESLIGQIHRESRQQRADFVAVTLSNPPQVYPKNFEALQTKLKELGAENLFYPDQRLAQLGQRENFPVITLAPYLQRYSQEQQVFLHGFANTAFGVGHWNAAGHQLAGAKIATELCRGLTKTTKPGPS